MGNDFKAGLHCRLTMRFQSTLPGWGATVVTLAGGLKDQFQSTLPGWGATTDFTTGEPLFYPFQSTLPGWGATV